MALGFALGLGIWFGCGFDWNKHDVVRCEGVLALGRGSGVEFVSGLGLELGFRSELGSGLALG